MLTALEVEGWEILVRGMILCELAQCQRLLTTLEYLEYYIPHPTVWVRV
jgi:hypothetical protein